MFSCSCFEITGNYAVSEHWHSGLFRFLMVFGHSYEISSNVDMFSADFLSDR